MDLEETCDSDPWPIIYLISDEYRCTTPEEFRKARDGLSESVLALFGQESALYEYATLKLGLTTVTVGVRATPPPLPSASTGSSSRVT